VLKIVVCENTDSDKGFIINYYGKPMKILSRDVQGSTLLRQQFKRAAWLDIAEQELDQWLDIMEG
jgi:hypothetical protein